MQVLRGQLGPFVDFAPLVDKPAETLGVHGHAVRRRRANGRSNSIDAGNADRAKAVLGHAELTGEFAIPAIG